MLNEFTASELTAFALEMLRLRKYRVRRVNNVGAYKTRKNQVEPGWPDVQGYDPSGKIVLCEIKKKGDRLSVDQEVRLADCYRCGGISLICYQDKNNAELINYIDYDTGRKAK